MITNLLSFSLQHRFDLYFKRLAEVSASRLLLELLSFLPPLGQTPGCHLFPSLIHFWVSGSSWKENGEKTRALAACLHWEASLVSLWLGLVLSATGGLRDGYSPHGFSR